MSTRDDEEAASGVPDAPSLADSGSTEPPARGESAGARETIDGDTHPVSPPGHGQREAAPGESVRGADETQPMKARRQPTLGGFILEERVGEGGMGIVFRARDPELDRPVAIKKILPEHADDGVFAERLVSEARAIARVTHPNIAQIYSIHASSDEHPPFFVMEFIDGESADQRVHRGGVLPVGEALDVVLQAARGLRAALRQGIVHGDVKPSNLVIQRNGLVKLVDFGLSRPIDLSSSRQPQGTVHCTPHYVSPEQARGLSPDHRSDMYSLGCTLYFLLTGEPPFRGDDREAILAAHLEQPLPDPRDSQSGLPAKVVSLVQRMLAKRPEERLPDYDHLVHELRGLLESISQEAPPRRRRRALVIFVVALVAVATLAGAEAMRQALASDGRRLPEPAQVLGDIFTPASSDGFERLEYVFADCGSEIPRSIRYPARTSDNPRRHLPGLLGVDLRWSNYDDILLFPYFSEIREVELSALRFSGNPDFELRLGYDPRQPQHQLRIYFGVGARNHELAECLADGLREPLVFDPKLLDFTVEPNTEYTLRLERVDPGTGPMATLRFRLVQVFPDRAEIDRVDVQISLPARAVKGGHVGILATGADFTDWSAYVQRVMIRGRLDRARLLELTGGS